MKKFAAILFTLILAASCSCEKNGPDNDFVESNDLELKVEGRVLLTYDPLTWQLGYKPQTRQFRVHNDNMSQYYILTCSEEPREVDQSIKASLKWSTGTSVNSRNDLSFKVVRIENDGRTWLWCNRGIGVSVRIIR